MWTALKVAFKPHPARDEDREVREATHRLRQTRVETQDAIGKLLRSLATTSPDPNRIGDRGHDQIHN